MSNQVAHGHSLENKTTEFCALNPTIFIAVRQIAFNQNRKWEIAHKGNLSIGQLTERQVQANTLFSKQNKHLTVTTYPFRSKIDEFFFPLLCVQ